MTVTTTLKLSRGVSNMKKAEVKERITQVDDRVLMMAKKYPFVFAFMVVVPFLVGFVIGKIL